MNANEVMNIIGEMIEETKVGMLATVDGEGKPHLTWMTPAILKGRPDTIFCVTSAKSEKVANIQAKPDVEWMLQSRALDRIVTLKGKINILDNPAIKAEVLENIGKKLTVFWKINEKDPEFVVLETCIQEGEYQLPVKGKSEVVRFEREDCK